MVEIATKNGSANWSLMGDKRFSLFTKQRKGFCVLHLIENHSENLICWLISSLETKEKKLMIEKLETFGWKDNSFSKNEETRWNNLHKHCSFHL